MRGSLYPYLVETAILIFWKAIFFLHGRVERAYERIYLSLPLWIRFTWDQCNVVFWIKEGILNLTRLMCEEQERKKINGRKTMKILLKQRTCTMANSFHALGPHFYTSFQLRGKQKKKKIGNIQHEFDIMAWCKLNQHWKFSSTAAARNQRRKIVNCAEKSVRGREKKWNKLHGISLNIGRVICALIVPAGHEETDEFK